MADAIVVQHVGLLTLAYERDVEGVGGVRQGVLQPNSSALPMTLTRFRETIVYSKAD